jgi:hypothetical protein
MNMTSTHLPFPIFLQTMRISRTKIGTLIATMATWAFMVGSVHGAEKEAAQPERTPYQAQGAPSNPKVDAHWNRYHDYAEATKLLKQLAETYPEFAKLQSLGKTYGDREMWVLTITNFEKGDDQDRPAMWIDGGIHANEIQAVEVVLYTAWYLLESREHNEFVRKLLDERVFYLLPMMSPDSRDAHFYEPNTTHGPRTGQRPVDDDKDGLVDEDDYDDLDGDGSITQMRLRDKNGKYKSHPDFPALMIEVKPGEKGEFTLLGQEGKDDDGDGEVNEDGDGYYDPNRDWPWNWQPDYVQNGAHRYPLSIGENRLVAEFIKKHPNIAAAQSYHNAGGMILRGPGAKDDTFDPADVRVYDAMGKQGEKMLPGYRYMNIAFELYEVYGGEVDWFHQQRGVFTFTNELFTPFNFFRTKEHEGFFGSDELRHQFNKYLLLDGGVSPWKEVDHPQYGKIEVGGLKKNWVRQPPSFLLEEELHRNMAFSLYHADQMPRVRVQSVEVKSLGGGVSEVTAVVENDRLMPTHSAADVKNKITPPDVLEISSGDENFEVLVGLTSNEPLFRNPDEQKRNPAKFELATVPGHGVRYVRWLVRGKGPFQVKLNSIKGGQDERMSAETQAD